MSLLDEIKESFLEIIAVFTFINAVITIAEFLDYFAQLTRTLPPNPTPDQTMIYLFKILWFWVPRLIVSTLISIVTGWTIHKIRGSNRAII